jgi:hypothetical protein
MAFTPFITHIFPDGAEKKIRGVYVNTGGSTGGAINTTLQGISWFSTMPYGSAIIASASVVNQTLPTAPAAGQNYPLNTPLYAGPNVTIVTSANESGTFEAVGY